jgi:hypothetical protein
MDIPTGAQLNEWQGFHNNHVALMILIDAAEAGDTVEALNAGAQAILRRSASRNEIVTVQRVPVPSGNHPAGDLALRPVYSELPRRRRFVGGTRYHGVLRNWLALGEPLRPMIAAILPNADPNPIRLGISQQAFLRAKFVNLTEPKPASRSDIAGAERRRRCRRFHNRAARRPAPRSYSEIDVSGRCCDIAYLFVQAVCALIAIALVHSDNGLAATITMGIFATGVAASVVLILPYDRPFIGQLSVGPLTYKSETNSLVI